MSPSVQCPSCATVYPIRPEILGRTVKCRCGTVFTIAAQAPPPPVASAPVLSSLPELAAPVQSPLGPQFVLRRRRRRTNWFKWVATGTGAAAVIGMVVGLVFWLTRERRGPSASDQRSPQRVFEAQWYLDVQDKHPRPFVVEAEVKAKEGQVLSSPEAAARMKAQAEEFGRALLGGDAQRVVGLTYPAVVKKMGGRDAALRIIGNGLTAMKGQGLQFGAMTYTEPSEIVEAKGKTYGYVSYQIPLTDSDGLRAVNSASLVGVSEDGGRNWTFLDMSTPAGQPAMFHELLPDFPSNLNVPPYVRPAWTR